jgi:hypothetical protein|nr:MAG TPA: hypothetical protein [Caudoviricetes sp.]
MEYGYHVVHYSAPTINMYIIELAGFKPVENYQRLGEVFYDGTEAMCRGFLDDLHEEVGGDRISSYGRESLVVTCGLGKEIPRRSDMTYHSSTEIDTPPQ